MQDIINTFLQFFTDNTAAAAAALAGALATGLALVLKAFFALAAKLAAKTTTNLDDQIVAETKKSFKKKSQDI